MLRSLELVVALSAVLMLVGCGSSSHDCTPTPLVVTVSPSSATANHTAAAPGNQAQFTFTTTGGEVGSSCAVSNQAVVETQWASTDSTDISFSDPSKGLATCTGATSGAATVSVTTGKNGAIGKGTASLTCN